MIPPGDEQPQQVIHLEGMGIDQFATVSGSDILIEATFQGVVICDLFHNGQP